MSQAPIIFGPRAVPSGRPRLVCSFSGGKTSGKMTKDCLDSLRDLYEIRVLFANTGEEREECLEFVRDCDRRFGFNTVWLEAVVNPESGAGTTHRVVTFETAARHGEPFEAVIKKYGIPNTSAPHCTRELKLRPIDSYLASIGWTEYTTAIGIRPDEARRVNKNAVAQNIVYPLIDMFYADKQDVNDWWEQQPFNLRLREHEGNCKWCWKKSFAKHARLLTERPEIYEFPARMEDLHGMAGARNEHTEGVPRVFFRGNTSTKQLAAKVFAIKPLALPPLSGPDEDAGCTESCEMYPMLDLEPA